jgi:hypothetical protein
MVPGVLYTSDFNKHYMDVLLRKIITYLAFILIPIGIGQSYKHYTLKALQSPALLFDTSLSTIVIGDSHTQTALNPELLDNCINISISDENYFYSYAKLRMLLRRNRPSTVILGFSWHNILTRSDIFIFDRSVNAFFLDNYFTLLDSDTIADIADSNDHFISAYLKYVCGIPAQIYTNDLAFKQALGIALKQSDFKFIGRYYNSDRSVINGSMIQQRSKDLFYSHDNGAMYAGTSPLMIKYLHFIAGLCNQYGIRLILFNAPVYQDFKKLIPSDAIRDFESVRQNVLAAYPHTEYIDFSELALERSWYGDGDHVNAAGSSVVSKLVLKKLDN